MATDDGDITIGPGKLLGLFFMLVAICGVFFAIGYSLGKTSAREQAMNDRTSLSASLTAPAVGDSSAAKPSAGVASRNEPEGGTTQEQKAQPSALDLTFFSAVKRSDGSKQTSTPEAAAPVASKAAEDKASQTPAAKTAVTPDKNAGTIVADASGASKASAKTDGKSAVTAITSGSFVVQIAAVTREEDAAALAGALRKKSYSVFVVNNPAVHDKFYHVQVGPFTSLQDAEAMKVKLTGEGYNPIVKRS